MNDTEKSKYDDWLKRAFSAFSKAITSPELTMFDQLLFVDQYMNLLVENDVHFASIPDKNIRRMRADRLKILGYRYVSVETRWTKSPLEPAHKE